MHRIHIENDLNPLMILESETPADMCNDEVTCGLFDFSENSFLNPSEEKQSTKRNSLMIVEEGDVRMDQAEDHEPANVHRLSVQVESGDENSLVMTNEAINQTIIRIGANDSNDDFGDSEEISSGRALEAVNSEIHGSFRRDSQSFPQDNDNEIVSILGQINDIVGSICSCSVSTIVKS
jgi:hypothetical protein